MKRATLDRAIEAVRGRFPSIDFGEAYRIALDVIEAVEQEIRREAEDDYRHWRERYEQDEKLKGTRQLPRPSHHRPAGAEGLAELDKLGRAV